MTQQLNSLGKSALLILSNTIIVLPFMIFIQIAKGTSLWCEPQKLDFLDKNNFLSFFCYFE